MKFLLPREIQHWHNWHSAKVVYLLSGRKKQCVVKNTNSQEFTFNCGVPQGSCLGPMLFMVYIRSLHQVISKYLQSVHGYADDYYETCVLDDCIKWMIQHRLIYVLKTSNLDYCHSFCVACQT
jgi:hypothetical protein